MKSTLLTILASVALGAQAHFQLLYPPPRGPFVEDQEPSFCGGYQNPVSNRTTFPLTGGFFRITEEHPDWSDSVLISVVQNPTSFDNFTVGGQSQYARLWANASEPGTYCIPLDIASANIPGAVDGANVTIQVVVNGEDGVLYQCSDLTLSSNYTAPAGLGSCVNGTTGTNATTTSGAQTGGPGASLLLSGLGAGVLGALVALAL